MSRAALKEIVISDGVNTIGDHAFSGCAVLGSVKLSNTVTRIGDFSFYGCTSLSSVNGCDSVTKIGNSAFFGCTSLSSLTLCKTLTSIGDSAFYNCVKLTSVALGDSLSFLGGSAFFGCTGLKELTVPASLNAVVSNEHPAFEGCVNIEKMIFTAGNGSWYQYGTDKSQEPYYIYTPWQLSKAALKNILISDGVKAIGNSAFKGCTLLASVSVSDSVTKIGDEAFGNCTSLSFLNLGKSVGSIGNSAFYNCVTLGSVSLPDSVTMIGPSAFYGCTGLKELTVPASLDTVVSNEHPVFEGCVNIEKFTFSAGSGDWYAYGVTSSDPSYYAYTPWQLSKAVLKDVTLSNGVRSIGDSAFTDCSNMTSVSLGNSIISIGDHAFNNCTSLSSVSIPSTVTSIGISAFEGCTSLASLVIPDSVTELGDLALKDCTGLKELTVPASLNCVGSNQSPIFSGCVNIEKVSFTAGSGTWYPYDSPSVTDNGHTNDSSDNDSELPYYGLTPWQLSRSVLNTVLISEGVLSVGNSAFKDCTGLTSVTIPSTVATIGTYAFRGCTSLASIDIRGDNEMYSLVDGVLFDKSMTTLIEYLAGNTNRSYTISDKVTTIGNYAFYDCTYLTSITIPSSVTSIGDSAFKGVFYDANGETALEPTAANLAGSTFEKTGDKWVKQTSSPADEKSGGNAMTYILVAVIAVIIVSVAVVVMKKRKA